MAGRRTGTSRGTKAEREFVSEAEEILERMRGDLADLSDQRAAGSEVDPELVNSLFRSAHSLKGLAGMFGFDPMHDLAHHLEDVLHALRLGRLSVESPAVALIDEALGIFTAQLARICSEESDEGAATEEDAAAIADLIERMSRGAEVAPASGGEFDALDLDPSMLRALTEYEEHRLRENIRAGRHIVLVESTFEIISFEEGLSEVSAAIREVGEVVSTLPSPGEAAESQIRFSLLAATGITAAALDSRMDFPRTTVRLALAGRDAADAADAPIAAETPGAEAENVAAATPALPVPPDVESLKSISDTVRVDIRKLDDLMNLVGELVIQRGAIAELVSALQKAPATARAGNDLAKIYKALDRKLRELQASVLDVRMVPLRQVFEKVSRVVRRLRRDLDKDVRLEIRGADTELDKLIIEDLVDPLMHVVRNAFDHAIEPVEEREAAGKDAQGCIRIEAFQRGNHVVIAVSDDGAGIDASAVRAGAERAGLVRADEVLTERETLDLIFAPGISTRSEVSETSGRGVGMDVVRSNATALGGVVDVESTPGRGTQITMTLPITLAIIQSLIVTVGGRRFAIPVTAVLETLLIDPSEVQQSEGREILNLRGEPLLLRRLSREFCLESDAPGGKQFVVVIGMGELRIGLLVDQLEGQQDTVIKPIQGPIQTVRGIAGATELGDQEPVLVIDTSALVEDAVRRREAA